MPIYAYPKLPWKYAHLGFMRLSGAGLGNLLFPWARAVVAARRFRLHLIWPTWPQLYLSRTLTNNLEYLKRHYFFYFRPTVDYITGIRKLRLFTRLRRVSEEYLEQDTGESDLIIVFEGMKNLFQPILGYHRVIKEELFRITAPRHLRNVKILPSPSISVHVRRGDMTSTSDLSLIRSNPWKYSLPTEWYAKQIAKLRHIVKREIPVFVFTDSQSHEIKPLISIKNVEVVHCGSAIADLLSLSTSDVLVASGSTFSLWASYLAQCPTIWFRGWLKQRVNISYSNTEVEVDHEEKLPESFIAFLKQRWCVNDS